MSNEKISDKAQELKDAVVNDINGKIDNEKKFVENKVEEVKENISARIENEKTYAQNKVNDIRNAFADKVSNLAEKIRN